MTYRVSIHSPRRSEGRHPRRHRGHRCRRFQSTPPAEARGDLWKAVCRGLRLCFNPLPPPKRGETCSGPYVPLDTSQFQSTPPAEARGDLWKAVCRGLRLCFNPLPPPKRGETCSGPYVPLDTSQFQSTPPAEARGDALGAVGVSGSVRVSIHSPRRSEGRPACW